MSRRTLHISVALLAFTVGFLTVGEFSNLAVALPLALVVFASTSLVENSRPTAFDSHKLKVVSLTLLLWIPLFAFFLSILPRSGFSDCMVVFYEEDTGTFGTAREEERAAVSEVEEDSSITGITATRAAGGTFSMPRRSHLGGEVDKKALTNPPPSILNWREKSM